MYGPLLPQIYLKIKQGRKKTLHKAPYLERQISMLLSEFQQLLLKDLFSSIQSPCVISGCLFICRFDRLTSDSCHDCTDLFTCCLFVLRRTNLTGYQSEAVTHGTEKLSR